MLTPSSRAAGFTLLEAMVTLSVFAILTTLAVPSLSTWVNNSKVRGAADSLQNGLRLAQSESLRRSRQVVFSLTNGTAPQSAIANGSSWSIYTIPSLAGEAAALIDTGDVTSATAGLTVTGPAAICFNSVGRLVANTTTTGVGANCALPTGTPPRSSYLFSKSGADRSLNVFVGLGGQVHMCDPGKVLSATDPDGCPP